MRRRHSPCSRCWFIKLLRGAVDSKRSLGKSANETQHSPSEEEESVFQAHPTFERHYRIGELAEMWKLGRETVRLLVKDEQGVIKIRRGRRKAHTIYSVPESVAVRIHTRLLNNS